MFKKASQNGVLQDIINQIQNAIISGKLTPGAKLPAERDLKDMFCTSRGTLREALRVLEQKGLIKIKRGVLGGAIIKHPNADPFMESLALLVRSGQVSLEHLAEFRIKIEGGLMALAVSRATDKDIGVLQELYKKAEACAEKNDIPSFLKTDENMHAYFGAITQNPIFQFVQKSIHDNIHQYYEAYLQMDENSLKENLDDMKTIIQAMKARDIQAATNAIVGHVTRFNEKMLKTTQDHHAASSRLKNALTG